MSIQRCPECGQRLKTNYCDICMRKVPFGGVRQVTRQDPWDIKDGSSAHRREKGHECVSFDMEKKPKTTFRSYRKSNAANKKGASVVAIILAILSLLPALFGLVEEAVESVPAPEPQYNVSDGFVEAGDLGAEDVPNVIAGEVYNDNGVRIHVDTAGLSYGDYVIYFTIYNDTDRKLGISGDMVSINGYMLPFGFYHDIKAGKSAQTSLAFYSYELEKAGITQISDVTFALSAYENNNYEPIFSNELVTLQTTAEVAAEPAVDVSGLELYNDGDIRIVLTDVSMPLYGECQLDLYMENFSDRPVNVFSAGAAVNGETVAYSMWSSLRSDTRAITSGYLYELNAMEIEEVSQIEEITLELYVEYLDGVHVAQTISEAVTFDPNAIK